MEESHQSLNTLPTEILDLVFRLLDPIGLVSTSQTNQRFRDLIQPTRIHFEERILALECQESISGITPHFQTRDNTISPDWINPQWEQMRWACPGCLRLLPHTMFDNHSLLRFAYRKPLPDHPAANMPTIWEPTGFGRRKGRHRPQNAPSKEDRHKYNIVLSCRCYREQNMTQLHKRLEIFQEQGFESFHNMTLTDFTDLTNGQETRLLDHEASIIEAQHCGYKRRLRRCLECLYKLKKHRPRRNGDGGTLAVPIVESRHIEVPSFLDRYFPGFWKVLDNKRPPTNAPTFMIYRSPTEAYWYTLQMIRCPGCAQWKEMRAFRIGHPSHRWTCRVYRNGYDVNCHWDMSAVTAESINNIRCPHCFIREHGRKAFGEDLLRWLNHALSFEKWDKHGNLTIGWNRIKHRLQSTPGRAQAPQKELKTQMLRIASAQRVDPSLSWLHAREESPIPYVPATEESWNNYNIAENRHYYDQWKQLRKELSGGDEPGMVDQNYTCPIWQDRYDDLEEHAYWLNNVSTEVFGEDQSLKMEALIDWALEDSLRVMPSVY